MNHLKTKYIGLHNNIYSIMFHDIHQSSPYLNVQVGSKYVLNHLVLQQPRSQLMPNAGRQIYTMV